MLKKKALTAVLTAAFVLGIGGMFFEPAVAHAAQATWRCWWCGKTVTTNADSKGYAYAPPRSGCGAKSATAKWGWYYGHGWICQSGRPAPTENTVYHCRDCLRIYITKGYTSPPEIKCPNTYYNHRWRDTDIKLYGKY